MKRLFLFLITILSTLTMSGCWDSTEPENLSLISVIGISTTNEHQIELVMQDQILTPKSQTQLSTSTLSYHLHKSTGITIFDAIQQAMSNNPQTIYLAHTKAIVVSEELATEQGFTPIIDFLERNPQIRQNTLLLISKKGEFEKIFNPDINLNMNSGKIIESIIDNRKQDASLYDCKLKTFLELVWGTYTTPYVFGIGTSKTVIDQKNVDINLNNQPDAYDLNLGDIAVFKDKSIVGWLTEDQSRGLLLANGKSKKSLISLNLDGNETTFKISNVKSKIRALIENNKLKVTMSLHVEAKIGERTAEMSFLDQNTIDKAQAALSEKIKSIVESAVIASKNLNSDVFQFGNLFFEKYPKYWKQNGADWSENYPFLDVEVTVQSNIQYTGLINKPMISK